MKDSPDVYVMSRCKFKFVIFLWCLFQFILWFLYINFFAKYTVCFLFTFVAWQILTEAGYYLAFKLGYHSTPEGQISYRENSKTSKTGLIVNLKLFTNPFIEKYANYKTYPFGRGADIKVVYVISGIYKGTEFRAFTYIFTGGTFESPDKGGVFSIVLIKCEKEPTKRLPENIFFEKVTLCSYLQGNLEVDTIHSRIEKLKEI